MKWFWGGLAIFALKRHYSREIKPYAEARGHSREAVKAAAHRALDRHFDAGWPSQCKADTPNVDRAP